MQNIGHAGGLMLGLILTILVRGKEDSRIYGVGA